MDHADAGLAGCRIVGVGGRRGTRGLDDPDPRLGVGIDRRVAAAGRIDVRIDRCVAAVSRIAVRIDRRVAAAGRIAVRVDRGGIAGAGRPRGGTDIAGAASLGARWGDQHDLLAVADQGDRVVVDVRDGETVDLAAELRQHVRRAAAVEQQRLMALRHHADHAQRDPARIATRVPRCIGAGPRGRLVRARERGEQGEREHTGDETHGARTCKRRSGGERSQFCPAASSPARATPQSIIILRACRWRREPSQSRCPRCGGSFTPRARHFRHTAVAQAPSTTRRLSRGRASHRSSWATASRWGRGAVRAGIGGDSAGVAPTPIRVAAHGEAPRAAAGGARPSWLPSARSRTDRDPRAP